MLIHATAIVDPRAELGAHVRVGPYAVIGAGVVLGVVLIAAIVNGSRKASDA